MPVDTFVLTHDTSGFARSSDPTDEGDVRRALDEWLPEHPKVSALSLKGHELRGDGNGITSSSLAEFVYEDGCGLGILQRVA
jgi:hypothetical protein